MIRTLLLVLALTGTGTGTATAQMQPVASARATPCPAAPPRLAPPFTGWSTPTPITAAATSRHLESATLAVGRGVTATLTPADKVDYDRPPEHAPAAGTSGGLFAFTVTEAGRYRIALGTTAWVDVVKDGQRLATSAHGHGPDCTGIRKMVDYALQPGRYVLQLSGSPAAVIEVMVARLPA